MSEDITSLRHDPVLQDSSILAPLLPNISDKKFNLPHRPWDSLVYLGLLPLDLK